MIRYKIEDNFEDSLKRINFIFQNQELFTECIKNHDGFTLLGKKYGPFEKGKKYRLKFFVALSFIEHNILKIASQDKCDNIDVQRFAYGEREDQKLIKHNKNLFLNKIKEFRYFMEKDVKDNKKPWRFLESFSSYYGNIIDGRLLKVLRLAKSKITLDDERRLTMAEKVLAYKFHELISIWRNFFLKNKKNN